MQSFTCVLCDKIILKEFGNNPAPLAHDGLCCDSCNVSKVIPARMKALNVKPVMTDAMRDAALELGDALGGFAMAYRLSDEWIKNMYMLAKVEAERVSGVDINNV